jgi:hypothetical protein
MVIISRFSGRPSDGHGHHQAMGILTPEALRAAADPNQFPEQITEGLRPWQARKLYVSASEKEATIKIDTGEYSPVFGRSFSQIGIAGRSLHRSQGEGSLQKTGPAWAYLKRVANGNPELEKETSIFDGLNVTLSGIADLVGAEETKVPYLRQALRAIEMLASQALRTFNPLNPHQCAPHLLSGRNQLKELRAKIEQSPLSDQAKYNTLFFLDKKIQDFTDAANKALGLYVDVLSNAAYFVPGQSYEISLHVFNRAPVTIMPVKLELLTPSDWAVTGAENKSVALQQSQEAQKKFEVKLPERAAYTQPYWLKRPRTGDRFVVDTAADKGLPFARSEVLGKVTYEAFGLAGELAQPLQYRYVDKSVGEIRHAVPVVIPVAVSVAPETLVLPVAQRVQERSVEVTLLSHVKSKVEGVVRLKISADKSAVVSLGAKSWSVSPDPAPFALNGEGERKTIKFQIKFPADAPEGSYKIEAQAEANGKTYDQGYKLVSYSHIEPRRLYRPAVVDVRAIGVKVEEDLNVGYIMGTGDAIPQVLGQLGVRVKLLDEDDLAGSDLQKYHTIIVGIRAYDVRQDLKAYNHRLLEFVRSGGTLIVQYQREGFAEARYAPYSFRMGKPPDRVTVEEAPVKILMPEHPLFNRPNKISGKDFDGWVQERGAYFMKEWDAAYHPLLASNDPGEALKSGGLLEARYGKGRYIYTAYAWFRQLPAGVPGAVRIFANLISLPK